MSTKLIKLFNFGYFFIIFIFLSVGPNGIIGQDVNEKKLLTNDNIPKVSNFPTESFSLCDQCNEVSKDLDRLKCRYISGLFTTPILPRGYTLITQIPKGACHVSINQIKPTRNYLSLRYPNGSNILNGNWEIIFSGDYSINEINFKYQRQEDNLNNIETIDISGPLISSLDLMLLYQSPNPGVKYEYKIPIDKPKSFLRGNLNENEHISPPYIDIRRHVKENIQTVANNINDFIKTPEMSNITTNYEPKYSESKIYPTSVYTQAQQGDDFILVTRPSVYNTTRRRKKYAWRVINLSECSRSCGGGTQASKIICVREFTHITVHERKCNHLEKPSLDSIRCNTQPCPPYWYADDNSWSRCSNECGKGYQIRNVQCMQEINSKLTIRVNETACYEIGATKPERERACFLKLCNNNEDENKKDNSIDNDFFHEKSFWKTGPWSECSTTCDNGYRTRTVTCMKNNQISFDCLTQNRPETTIPCRNSACLITFNAKTKLTVSDTKDAQFKPTIPMDRTTNLNSKHPETVFSYKTTPLYSNTKVENEQILKHSKNSNLDIKDSNQIKKDNKLQSDLFSFNSLSNLHSPSYISNFTTTNLNAPSSQSSTTTKQFYLNRKDYHIIPKETYLVSHNDSTKPFEPSTKFYQPNIEKIDLQTRQFNSISTKSWKDHAIQSKINEDISNEFNHPNYWLATEWSHECSNECGLGYQYRQVVCDLGKNCTDQTRPDTSRSCTNDKNCKSKWFVGPWSNCIQDECNSQPIQKRDILCVAYIKGQFRIVADKTCSLTTKPETEKLCDVTEIFENDNCKSKWYIGEWSNCDSDNCDNTTNIKYRTVKCLDINGKLSNLCDKTLRPIETSPCLIPKNCQKQNHQSNVVNRSIETHDEPFHDSSCVDTIQLCKVAVQARLCSYKYYETACCLSCNRASNDNHP